MNKKVKLKLLAQVRFGDPLRLLRSPPPQNPIAGAAAATLSAPVGASPILFSPLPGPGTFSTVPPLQGLTFASGLLQECGPEPEPRPAVTSWEALGHRHRLSGPPDLHGITPTESVRRTVICTREPEARAPGSAL